MSTQTVWIDFRTLCESVFFSTVLKVHLAPAPYGSDKSSFKGAIARTHAIQRMPLCS